MKRYKWVITGGHHNSALVVALELKTNGQQILWYGHRHAAGDDRSDSAEYREVKAQKITFHNLQAGKSTLNILSFLKIPLGIIQAIIFLLRDKPQAVVIFGGYLGFATGVAAMILGIPFFIHEQTVVSGKANLFLSRFAKRTYLTWASSIPYFSKALSLKVVGLPIRPKFLLNSRVQSIFANHKPTLFFLCGKQGSHKINEYIFTNYKTLLSRYNIIHQTGTHTKYKDYEKAQTLRSGMSQTLQNSYHPFEYAGESDIVSYMDSSDLVIGRSGAHTTYELAVKGKKSILIPYLYTYGQEQLQNAEFLVKNGLGVINFEDELSFPKLRENIEKMLKRRRCKPLDLPLSVGSVMIQDMLDQIERSKK